MENTNSNQNIREEFGDWIAKIPPESIVKEEVFDEFQKREKEFLDRVQNQHEETLKVLNGILNTENEESNGKE